MKHNEAWKMTDTDQTYSTVASFLMYAFFGDTLFWFDNTSHSGRHVIRQNVLFYVGAAGQSGGCSIVEDGQEKLN